MVVRGTVPHHRIEHIGPPPGLAHGGAARPCPAGAESELNADWNNASARTDTIL